MNKKTMEDLYFTAGKVQDAIVAEIAGDLFAKARTAKTDDDFRAVSNEAVARCRGYGDLAEVIHSMIGHQIAMTKSSLLYYKNHQTAGTNRATTGAKE